MEEIPDLAKTLADARSGTVAFIKSKMHLVKTMFEQNKGQAILAGNLCDVSDKAGCDDGSKSINRATL